MIKRFNQFNESLLNKLEGPSYEETKEMFLNGKLRIENYYNACKKMGWEEPTVEEINKHLHNKDAWDRFESGLEMGNLNIIKNLIEKGDNKGNVLDLKNDEVIYTAALFGDLEIVKYLLDAGAYVDEDVIDHVKHELVEENEENDEEYEELFDLLNSYVVKDDEKSHIRYKPKVSKFKQFITKIKNKL